MDVMAQSGMLNSNKILQAFIIGVALGDGNLSNPNGRAVRLRITCDKGYPILIDHIATKLRELFPENKVSFIDRNRAVDICLYSNHLVALLGYSWNFGPKDQQNVGIPDWVKEDTQYAKECLRGLFQTDGSIYHDRGYLMINFVNACEQLAEDVYRMIQSLGYTPNIQRLFQSNQKIKHTIRLSRETKRFINEIQLWKM